MKKNEQINTYNESGKIHGWWVSFYIKRISGESDYSKPCFKHFYLNGKCQIFQHYNFEGGLITEIIYID